MKYILVLIAIISVCSFSPAKKKQNPDLVIDMNRNYELCYQLNPNSKEYKCSIISGKKLVGFLLTQ